MILLFSRLLPPLCLLPVCLLCGQTATIFNHLDITVFYLVQEDPDHSGYDLVGLRITPLRSASSILLPPPLPHHLPHLYIFPNP